MKVLKNGKHVSCTVQRGDDFCILTWKFGGTVIQHAMDPLVVLELSEHLERRVRECFPPEAETPKVQA